MKKILFYLLLLLLVLVVFMLISSFLMLGRLEAAPLSNIEEYTVHGRIFLDGRFDWGLNLDLRFTGPAEWTVRTREGYFKLVLPRGKYTVEAIPVGDTANILQCPSPFEIVVEDDYQFFVNCVRKKVVHAADVVPATGISGYVCIEPLDFDGQCELGFLSYPVEGATVVATRYGGPTMATVTYSSGLYVFGLPLGGGWWEVKVKEETLSVDTDRFQYRCIPNAYADYLGDNTSIRWDFPCARVIHLPLVMN